MSLDVEALLALDVTVDDTGALRVAGELVDMDRLHRLASRWQREAARAIATRYENLRRAHEASCLARIAEMHGLTHVESRGFLRGWARVWCARKDGLPALIVKHLDVFNVEPAHLWSEVGEGPELECRAPRGRKWRTREQTPDYQHIGTWRLKP